VNEPFVWTDAAVREALGLSTTPREDLVFERVHTDSRSVREGDLFVALVGDRFDGHDFVADAVAAGATGAVVSHPVAGAGDAVVYPVDDTLVALGALARHRRLALPARVVGITGSSGKTGTKELTAAALRTTLRVHATAGNYNNRIGLPLTLLAAPTATEVVVAEMGTNEPGEIALLAAIAVPDVAVVTTVGESHLEKLGGVDGVLEEKLDLVRALDEGDLAVVGAEPAALPRAARELHPRVRVAGFGPEADDDLRPDDVSADEVGRHAFAWGEERIELRTPGRHVVANALLALAVAEAFDVPAGAAAAGVAGVEPDPMRGEIRRVGPLTLLVDCYNANPQSVRAALELLEAQGSGPRGSEAGGSGIRRVAILGSMLELGAQSDRLHRSVLRDALGRTIDRIVATGAFARAAADLDADEREEAGARLIAVPEPEVAYRALRDELSGDETILLKASRGVRMEELVPLFEQDFGEVA